MRFVKRVLLVLIVLFCVFYLVSRPEDAAAAVRGAIDAVANAGASIITFFQTLAG